MVKKGFIIILSIAVFTSCSFIARQYEADPIMKQQTKLLKEGSEYMVDEGVLGKRVEKATTKATRNNLINELIMISDRACSLHQAKIIANANTWNIATGTTTNILSALGAVVGGEASKAALAAGASFSGGMRSLINEEVYLESVGTTIVRAISVAREKYYAEIKNKMKDLDPADYSIEAGLRDVHEYHRRCSFYYGLLEVSKSLEQRKETKSELKADIDDLMQYKEELERKGMGTSDVESRINELILRKSQAPN